MLPQKASRYHWSRWFLLFAILFAIIYSTVTYVGSLQKKQDKMVPPTAPTSTPVSSVTPTDATTKGKMCGGIAGIACPTGYACKLDGDYPDAGGTCVEGTMQKSTPAPSEQVFCTMEAKECPDGSFVGRQGPKCEFAACPKPQ